MSELPPDYPEVSNTGTPIDAPESGFEPETLSVSNGHDTLGGDRTLVEDTPGGAFGELEEDGNADVIDFKHKDDGADLLGDDPAGADVLYPTFGVPSVNETASEQGRQDSSVATIHDINGEAVPDEHADTGDSIAEEEIDDTPQGSRDYPAELIDRADILIGRGDEDAAFRLLQAYDDSQVMPEIPKQSTSPEDEDPEDNLTDTLF
jgi:hypothetical protein